MECHRNYAEKVVFATEDCVMSTPLEISKASLSPGREAETHEPVDSQKVQEYVLILEDKQTSQQRRNQAILALMQMHNRSAVPALIAQVEGNYGLIVKQNAIRALGKIGDKRAVAPLLKILKEPVKGDTADEGEEEAIVRRSAVLALGEIGDASALPVLEAATQDTTEYQSVRELAAIAAEKIKASESEGDELGE
jgi:HEAT repeat protein